MQTFQTWDGESAEAAKSAVGRTRVDFDQHGAHVAAIAAAAQTARDEVELIKSKLSQLRADAAAQGCIIGADGAVRSVIQTVVTAEVAAQMAANREALQIRVNQLLVNAQMTDADLASAIKGADGELSAEDLAKQSHGADYAAVYGIGALGLPEYPDSSLSNAEARNYYAEAERRLGTLNETLSQSNLPLEERVDSCRPQERDSYENTRSDVGSTDGDGFV